MITAILKLRFTHAIICKVIAIWGLHYQKKMNLCWCFLNRPVNSCICSTGSCRACYVCETKTREELVSEFFSKLRAAPILRMGNALMVNHVPVSKRKLHNVTKR